MWICAYNLFSLYLDLMIAACVVWNVDVSGWLFYVRCGLKLVLLVVLVWRFSHRTSEAWVAAIILIASMLFVSTWCRVSSDALGTTPAVEEIIALCINRIVETLVTVMLMWLGKLSPHDASRQVVPLPSLDTSKFVSRTCTWVEVCGLCDAARGIEHVEVCSICLERFELDEVVTQLTCKHVFHTHCASQWTLRCATRRRGGSLCPMRCALTEVDGPSVA
eukprot:TRINITY_DN5688_c0_g2_i2.p1 TRINITY_DN5688_c0_g2~~TRINITY_DN5688_c0_g2_i2.p1  ORF type:complete len:220 (+),score=8.00 TRINITY_DN5688_c0_g2_i2:88-747(+)